MQAGITEYRVLFAKLAILAGAFLASAPALAGCSLHVVADFPVTMEGARLSVPAKVNGQDTRFWLDSGAYFSMMSLAKAKELGLHPELPRRFGAAMQGVGGSVAVQVAPIKSFVIAGQTIPDREFLVGGSDAGNGLIGSDILGLADTEFDLADGTVKMMESQGCEHTALSYWAVGKPFFTVPLITTRGDHVFTLPVMINNRQIEAEFDTGAETSVISRSAALRIGIDLAGPGVVQNVGGSSGIGGHAVRSWSVPIAKVSVGEEQVLNTHIEVVEDYGNSFFDMLLGEDFIMAHHIYVARREHMVFFTYSGGPPFRTSRELAPAATDNAAAAQAIRLAPPPPETSQVLAVNSGIEPKTADAFARRGAARLAVQDPGGALADYNAAIRQSPDTADYYAGRARVYHQSGNAAGERADLDKALSLDSANGEFLRMRAGQRRAAKDREGALADAEAAQRITSPVSLDSARLATLFVRLHQPARAIPMLDAVIAAHRDGSELAELLNARCWARALADVDLDSALADCNRAIRAGVTPDRLDSRALVYFRKANFAAAIGDFSAGLKIDPRLAWSLYVRGLAESAVGQGDAGKADQAAARGLQPDIAEDVAGYGIGVVGAKAP